MLKHLNRVGMAFVFSLVLCGVAHSQEVWWFDEIYSNADGSVQFIAFSRVASNYGPLLAGQTLVSNGREFVFGSEPTFATATGIYRVLVGTHGFADLHLVAPDFVVPNGFVSTINGSISIDGCAVKYSTLPTDGVLALYPGGCDGSADADLPYVATATATNFAGQSHSFSKFGGMNYGGLWWHDPTDSEPGWGIIVEHQADIVFAAWGTYDVDGAPVWFVMPRAEQRAWNRYEGSIYQTAGPAFSTAQFDSSSVRVTEVGYGGFEFDRLGNALFFYSVGLVSATRRITRQVFADPVSVCAPGGMPGPTPNYQGLWWNPAESGWGLHLTQQGDILFAWWFTGAGHVVRHVEPTQDGG